MVYALTQVTTSMLLYINSEFSGISIRYLPPLYFALSNAGLKTLLVF